MESSKGDHRQLEILENLELEDELENMNPFLKIGSVNRVAQGGLEKRLLHALDLNGGRVKVNIVNFNGKMYAEDCLDWKPI